MRDDYYAQALPTASDVLLVIEVADTSIEIDRSVKLPLYARAGVPATMLVDLTREMIEIHSGPVNGQYQSTQIFRRGESFQLQALPRISLRVDAILG
jgi:Uma2 family endonuclease